MKKLGLALAALLMTTAAAPPGAAPARDWAAFRDGYIEETFQIDPSFAVYEGRHDFDGRLPDWSEAGLAKAATFYRGSIERARAFPDSSLRPADRFERDYLIKVAEGRLFWLTDADQPHRNPAYYVGNGLDPNVYIARPMPTHRRGCAR